MKRTVMVVALLLFDPSLASALDTKVISGSACMGNGSADLVGFFQPQAAFSSWTVCPIVRDNHTEELDHVWVTLAQRLGAVSECYVSVLGNSDVEFDRSEKQSSNASGTPVVQFDLSDMQDYSTGSYVVTCALGTGTRISYLRWREL